MEAPGVMARVAGVEMDAPGVMALAGVEVALALAGVDRLEPETYGGDRSASLVQAPTAHRAREVTTLPAVMELPGLLRLAPGLLRLAPGLLRLAPGLLMRLAPGLLMRLAPGLPRLAPVAAGMIAW
jgi:hypothetical protein